MRIGWGFGLVASLKLHPGEVLPVKCPTLNVSSFNAGTEAGLQGLHFSEPSPLNSVYILASPLSFSAEFQLPSLLPFFNTLQLFSSVPATFP